MADLKFTSYTQLKGADFSTDPSRIDRSRSPDVLNMISDEGGNPVKRKGFEYVISESDVTEAGFSKFRRLHNIGDSVAVEYEDTSSNRRIFKHTNSTPSPVTGSFGSGAKIRYNDSLYIYDRKQASGEGLNSYNPYAKISDSENGYTVSGDTTSPKVLIATDPDTGAGTSYDNVNALSQKRTVGYMWGNGFNIKGSPPNYSAILTKSPAELDALTTYTEADAYVIYPSGTAKGVTFEAGDIAVCTCTNTASSQASDEHWKKLSLNIKVVVPSGREISSTGGVLDTTVRSLKNDGSWNTVTNGTWGPKTVDAGITYYIYRMPSYGSVIGESLPAITISDNIEITYKLSVTASSQVFYDEYKAGTVWKDRVFLGGGSNADRKNRVYYSELGDPSYIADVNYITVDGTVSGLVPIGDALAVLKEENDKSVDFITESSVTDTITDANGNSTTLERTVYKITHGITGFGCLSNGSVNALSGEPLFLTRNGVYGIVIGSNSDSKYIKNRSYLVDKKLTREPISDLKNACAISFKNYYILSVGEHCYILDARQKTTDIRGNTTYLYEAYYWDNILARSFAVIPSTGVNDYGKDYLWFVRDDGTDTSVCRFKDSDRNSDYSDGTDATDSTVTGTAINSHFATLFDNDGTTAFYKTLQKKGTGCSVVPDSRSSVTVYLNKDDTGDVLVGTTYADRFSFDDIDFSRFTFEASELARDYYFRKKNKRYKRLQIKLENNAINESFGILEIFKTYALGNYAKR